MSTETHSLLTGGRVDQCGTTSLKVEADANPKRIPDPGAKMADINTGAEFAQPFRKIAPQPRWAVSEGKN